MNKNQNELKSEIKDALTCFICLDKIKDPLVCLQCKKLGCKECLKKWFLTSNVCPYCKKVTNIDEMIQLNFLNDISTYYYDKVSDNKQIDEEEEENHQDIDNNSKNDYLYKTQIFSNNININEINNQGKINNLINYSKEGRCSKHPNQPIEYICLDCETKHCQKCLLIFENDSKIHEGHFVISLETDEKYRLQRTIREIKTISNVKGILEKYSDNISTEQRICKSEEEIILKMIDEFKDLYKERLSDKKNELKSKREKIQERIEDIDKISQYSEDAVKNYVKLKDEQGIKNYLKKIELLKKVDEFKHSQRFETCFHPKLEIYKSEFFELDVNLDDEILGEKEFTIEGFNNELKIKMVSEAENEISLTVIIQLNDLLEKENKKFCASVILKRSYEYIRPLNLDERMAHDGFLILGKTLIKNSLNEFINRYLHKCTLKVIICHIEV